MLHMFADFLHAGMRSKCLPELVLDKRPQPTEILLLPPLGKFATPLSRSAFGLNRFPHGINSGAVARATGENCRRSSRLPAGQGPQRIAVLPRSKFSGIAIITIRLVDRDHVEQF